MKKVSSAILFAAAALISCIFFLHPPAARATSTNISQIAFTSDVQTIATGTFSAAITIQTQNAGGTSEKLDNTSSASFTSSSATGEFSSNASNWIPVSKLTMSKNSFNKNFFYKDSAAGNDTITVVVTEGTFGTSWTASQVIHVGTSAPSGSSGGSSDSSMNSDSGGAAGTATTTEDSSATSTATTTASDDSSPGGSSGVSSHSYPERLSYYSADPAFSLGAGRDRLVLAGSPLLFRANLSGNVRPNLSWSFGDGATSDDAEISHTYYFPGSYEVVLNADSGSLHGTARSKVHVIEPSFSLEAVPEGGLKITNGSAYEANISGWQIVAGNSHFSFPRDTIIAPESSVAFPSSITGVAPGSDAAFYSPAGTIAASSFGSAALAVAPQSPQLTASANVPAPAGSLSQSDPKPAIPHADTTMAISGGQRPKDIFSSVPVSRNAARADEEIAPRAAADTSGSDDRIKASASAGVSGSIDAAESESVWTKIKNFFVDIF